MEYKVGDKVYVPNNFWGEGDWQHAHAPSVVKEMLASQDKVLEIRIIVDTDTKRYRLSDNWVYAEGWVQPYNNEDELFKQLLLES